MVYVLLAFFAVTGMGYIIERDRRITRGRAIQDAINFLERVDHSYANGNTFGGIDEGEYYGKLGEQALLDILKKTVE